MCFTVDFGPLSWPAQTCQATLPWSDLSDVFQVDDDEMYRLLVDVRDSLRRYRRSVTSPTSELPSLTSPTSELPSLTSPSQPETDRGQRWGGRWHVENGALTCVMALQWEWGWQVSCSEGSRGDRCQLYTQWSSCTGCLLSHSEVGSDRCHLSPKVDWWRLSSDALWVSEECQGMCRRPVTDVICHVTVTGDILPCFRTLP